MFVVYKRDIADVEPIEHLPGADGLVLGEAASLTAGALAKCAATARPDYIVLGPVHNGLYPAIRVQRTTVFEVPCSAAVAAAGAVVTLGTDALTVTATTTSGVFTVEYTENAANTLVRGRFA